MPISAILQPPKKKVKRKIKVAKKRQKIIPVPSPLLSPLPLSPTTPAEPISVNKVNKDEDENTKKPIEVEDEDINSLPPLLPTRFISI